MAGVSLYDYQLDAVNRMKNGCILCGKVGSGKSRTALAYYYILNGGAIGTKKYIKMQNPIDLYIITTARKRDTYEWEGELVPFLLDTDSSVYSNKVIIDSWNNIKKYSDIKNSFFIFDEQRVVGSGAWTKAFLKIAKSNKWILLSATPGDTWSDYIPVFIANGFYSNRSQFTKEHIIYKRFSKFPQIDRYIDTGKLIKLRNSILVDMDYERKTESKHIDITVDYDKIGYREIQKERWDIYRNEPITNASQLCYTLRKLVNSSSDRLTKVLEITEEHNKSIIFYNFDYERELLLGIYLNSDYEVAEWSGHAHQPVPDSSKWVYLVQYTAGCEGWNCITTDTIIFYSQNYSYKVMEQASGRINRLNTPFLKLYYYHLKSNSKIDIAIARALKNKQNFNEGKFANA